MKKSILLVAVVAAMTLAGTAGSALVPGITDPGPTGCPTSTFTAGVLHLATTCTATGVAARADITGLETQMFASATFTLANAAQCQSTSPRFDIVTSVGTFALGCGNVAPTPNGNGTLTYLFNATTIAEGSGGTMPAGTITSVDVVLDVMGSADLSTIAVNGVAQVPATTTPGGAVPATKADCKHGGWKTFTNPSFKNQGRCVSWVNHQRPHGKHAAKSGETSQAGSESDDETAEAQATTDAKKAEHGRKAGGSKGGKHGK